MTAQQKARKSHQFSIVEYAEISSAHLTATDGAVVFSKEPCSFRLAVGIDDVPHWFCDNGGAFFYVPDEEYVPNADMEERLRGCALSEAFIEIFKILREQGINYVRFDCNIDPVDSLPVFNW